MSEVTKVYEEYLEELKKFPKGDRLPTGETVEEEVKRVSSHLGNLRERATKPFVFTQTKFKAKISL